MMEFFLLSLLLVSLSLNIIVIKAQKDQPGFISIDCGLQGSNYTDDVYGLYYTSDVGYVDSGVSQSVATEYDNDDYYEDLRTVRYFPVGSRNCYTLRPVQGKGSKYLIRARFVYGNYDGLNQPPKFDLHIGNQYWDTITIVNDTIVARREIIHSPSSDHIHVCLVKTGPGIPFISTLELRTLDSKMYPTKEQNASLNLVFRSNINGDRSIRFKDDIYDRIWLRAPFFNTRTLNTTSLVDNNANFLTPPSAVMSTAAVALKTSAHLRFVWDADVKSKFYMFLYFAELEVLEADQTRVIDVYVNDEYLYGNFSPPYLRAVVLYNVSPLTGNTTYTFDIAANPRTTLPPLINAAEVYSLVEFPLQETFEGDVEALVKIKTTYNLTENWQGDPCGPEGFQWNGVNCTNDGLSKPKIISLNLSSKRLVGSISPAIFELKALQTLDLSNNLLSGGLPDFLAELDSLTVLNLRGNNFSGSCPQQLLGKANTGKLNLVSDSLCGDGGGGGGGGSVEVKKKKGNIVIPIAAAAGGVFFVICALFSAFYIMKSCKQTGTLAKVDNEADNKLGIDNDNITKNPNFVAGDKRRRFTYQEVLQITNNFNAVIGEGGFGIVYHGYVGGSQVAVKMLSASSSQGYKEFHSEATLLLTIHHKNLTSLVGYCNENKHMAIIYDYMPNGNMEKHLLGKGPSILTWVERLRMAIDAAEGLEYLHHGCKHAIVHRDVKMTNILVDENFRAKLGDFGLSRAFSVEDATHVSTVVAGTPGYLDPEYYETTRLTEKSDVYSFGVVLLEVVSGRPAVPRNNEMPHIITWVSSELKTGDLDRVIDSKLRGRYAVNSAWNVLEVAMSCVARNSVKRPTMNFVVTELKASLTMEMRCNEIESKDSIRLNSMNMESGFDPQAR